MNEGGSSKQKDGLGSVDEELPDVDTDLPDVKYIVIDTGLIWFNLSKLEERFITTNQVLDWRRDHKDFKCLRAWSAREKSPLSGNQMNELFLTASVNWEKFSRDGIKCFLVTDMLQSIKNGVD